MNCIHFLGMKDVAGAVQRW